MLHTAKMLINLEHGWSAESNLVVCTVSYNIVNSQGTGYETQQSSLLYVVVRFFGLDREQNTIVVYSMLRQKTCSLPERLCDWFTVCFRYRLYRCSWPIARLNFAGSRFETARIQRSLSF